MNRGKMPVKIFVNFAPHFECNHVFIFGKTMTAIAARE